MASASVVPGLNASSEFSSGSSAAGCCPKGTEASAAGTPCAPAPLPFPTASPDAPSERLLERRPRPSALSGLTPVLAAVLVSSNAPPNASSTQCFASASGDPTGCLTAVEGAVAAASSAGPVSAPVSRSVKCARRCGRIPTGCTASLLPAVWLECGSALDCGLPGCAGAPSARGPLSASSAGPASRADKATLARPPPALLPTNAFCGAAAWACIGPLAGVSSASSGPWPATAVLVAVVPCRSAAALPCSCRARLRPPSAASGVCATACGAAASCRAGTTCGAAAGCCAAAGCGATAGCCVAAGCRATAGCDATALCGFDLYVMARIAASKSALRRTVRAARTQAAISGSLSPMSPAQGSINKSHESGLG
mmetsp:Transcript_76414/g.202915  ORF Transcript_76414/g.202915 Transcript_76414/m.202915 type:complete len:369 (+) Transcript_76414:449-1555(+)